MGDPAPKRSTYEDLLDVPENLVAEIIDGVLYTSPRPASPHALASTMLIGDLNVMFHRGRGGPGGWIILFEPELHVGGDALVPDIAGWRRTRMPEMPGTAAFELAPDWVCEILSPGNTVHDRKRKMPVYAREGVRHIWLVDPLEKSLDVYRLEGGMWQLVVTYGDDEMIRAEPFDAVEIELGALWKR